MGFLAGRMTYERFQVQGESPRMFEQEHIDLLEKYAIGQIEAISIEAPTVGFLAGKHLFDTKFELDKNVFLDALHAAVRIDISKVPGPLKKAWMEMELQTLAAESPNGKVTRAMRQQAKESVQARCEEEIRSGRFRRMQQVPFLWHAGLNIVFCGTTSVGPQDQLRGLFEKAYSLELRRITAGYLAGQLAVQHGWTDELASVRPSNFGESMATEHVAWLTEQPDSVDYLGNEFLMWLWWWLETQSEEIELPDETQVTVMLNRTLALECPLGESGRETITAESPTVLPESMQAVRSGKLPRKMGMTLVRDGEQYDLVVQAESLSLSGAAIHSDGDDRGRGALEERMAAIGRLNDTMDLLYAAFLSRRLVPKWSAELADIRSWMQTDLTAEMRRAG